MPDFIHDKKIYYNPVEFAMNRIGGTWKMPILWRLKEGTKRYGELKRTLPKTTDKMLTASLRQLEETGFITRTVHAVIPPKTEYNLTDRGRRSIEIISIIREYGLELMQEEGIDCE